MLKQINEKPGMANKELKVVYAVSVLHMGNITNILNILVFKDRKYNNNGQKRYAIKIKACVPILDTLECATTKSVFDWAFAEEGNIISALSSLGFPKADEFSLDATFQKIARMTLGEDVKLSPENYHVVTFHND